MANETPLLSALLQGNMDAGGFQITNSGGMVLTAGDITLFQDPTLALHAVTKQYADLLGAGSSLTAGRGVAISAGPTYDINFAQDSDYTVDEIPFATGLTTMGFSSDLSWDDTGKILVVNGAIQTVDEMLFDTGFGGSSQIAALAWNDISKTLEVQCTTDVTLQIGQENHLYSHNDTGGPITNGQPVRIVGSTLGFPEIALADITPRTQARATIGLATETIADTTQGFVTLSGLVRDVNTNLWNEGDALFVSGTGTLSNVPPAKPNSTTIVGVVLVKNATTGVILALDPDTVPILDELTDVDVSAKADGDTIVWDSGASTWTSTPFELSQLEDYTADAGIQAGSIVLRNAADTGWTDGGAFLRWDDINKYLKVLGPNGNGQLWLQDSGGLTGYSAATIGCDDNSAGFHITAHDVIGALPDVEIFGFDTLGNMTLLSGSNRNVTVTAPGTGVVTITAPGTGYIDLVTNATDGVYVNTNTFLDSDYLGFNGGSGEIRWNDLPNYVHKILQNGNVLEWYRPGAAPGSTLPNLYSVGGTSGGFYTAGRLGVLTAVLPAFAGLEVNGDIRQTAASGDAWLNLIGGGVYQAATSNVTTIAAAVTWYELGGPFTGGPTNGITLDTTNGRLTPTVAGNYFVMWSLSFTMASNNQDIEMAILKNGTAGVQPYGRGRRRTSATTDTGNANGHGIIAMNGTTDYVSLGVYNATSAANLTTYHSQLTAFRVGE